MYLLVSNSRVIEEVSEVETAHERAVELAKKLKNDVQLVKVEGVAQHKIVFTPSKVEIPGPVEIKETSFAKDDIVSVLVKPVVTEIKKVIKKESAPAPVKQAGMNEEVFNKLLNDYETKLKSVDGFMDFDAVVQDFDSIFTDLTNEQSATVKSIQSLNYDRIDSKLKVLLSKDKDKKLETIEELKAIDEQIPPVFDEKEFKDKCKEAFSHAQTKARLEEYRDHLLEENKDFDKVAKPIIFQAFYERLSNLQTSKPKYVGV